MQKWAEIYRHTSLLIRVNFLISIESLKDYFRRAWSNVNRAARNTAGASAVEFAMIAAPLFITILGATEIILVTLVSASLMGATTLAARDIRTGVAASTSATAASFKTSICSKMSWLGANCTANLSVDVESFNNFSAVTQPTAVSGGSFTNPGNFDLGNPGQVVLVTTYYQWPLVTPLLNTALGALSNGQLVLTAVTAFRNEPY